MATTKLHLGSQAQDDTLTNAKVKSDAAIDYSKLATLTSANILVGDGSNVATSVAMSGDIAIDNSGATSFNGSPIVNADINASAAIDLSKLEAMASGTIVVGSAGTVATEVSMSGDMTIIADGTISFNGSPIVNADINSGAAIDLSKLEAMASGTIIVGSAGTVATEVSMSGDMTLAADGTISFNGSPIVNADIAGGAAIALSKLAEAVIQADGGQAFTSDQPMGTNKITGLADGTASGDAVNKSQMDAAVAGLQWLTPVAVKEVIGSEDVATINGFGAVTAGDAYIMTDGGDLTEGGGADPTVAAGDIVEFDGVDWILVTTNAGNFPPDGTRAIASTQTALNGTIGLTDGVDDGKTLTWDGTSLTPATETTSADGDAVLVSGDGGFFENNAFVFSGSVPTGTWIQFSAPGGDATTLDGLDSTQFLRSDASDSITGSVTLTVTSGSTVDFPTGSTLDCSDAGGTYHFNEAVDLTSTSTELNLLDGITGTVWSSDNDGTGTGLDADLLDGQEGAAYLRNDIAASWGVSGSGATLTLGDVTGGADTIDIGANILDCSDTGGTYYFNEAVDMTSTSTELNILDGATVTTSELNALGTIAVRETPTGTINSVNRYFLLAAAPIANQEEAYLNGVQQDDAGNSPASTTATLVFTNASTTVTTNLANASDEFSVGQVIRSSNDDALGVIVTVDSPTVDDFVLSANWDGATIGPATGTVITINDDYAISGKSMAFASAPTTGSKIRVTSRS